ncbi:MAG TPA: transglycosylase SLT domain-containing protein [Rhizomicrobium sp.]
MALRVARQYWAVLAAGVACVLIVGGLFLIPRDRTMPPAVTVQKKPARTTIRKPPALPKKIAVTKPSAFDLEQQMSFSQLMNRWNPAIAEAAKKYGVPQPWIRAVMQIESGGRTMLGEKQPIKSSMGAMGLMQLMPETYNDMRLQNGLGKDPYDPHDNIMAGAAYLRFLRVRYGYPQMFAAYNDGPGNLEARMMGRGLLPVETQNYMVNITNAMAHGGAGGHGAMVKFTRPNGETATINAAAVVSVRAAFPGEYAPGVQSVITVGRLHQGVRESLAQARAIIRAHGGGI